MASYLPEFHAPHRHSHHHARQNKPAPIGIPTDTKEANASAPKTPADDAIDFFESAVQHGEPAIQVYELKLEEDGGPNKSRVVSVQPLARGVSRERDLGNSCLAPQYTRLPPPYRPYILRVCLEAGTPPCKNGVFRTNFPLNGGAFERNTYVERK